MSYLLESLGRGLLGRLFDAFSPQFPPNERDDLEQLRKRAALSPTSVDLAVRIGCALLADQRYQPAREEFERALRIDPGAKLALLGLAAAQDALGDDAAAMQHLLRAEQLDAGDPAIAFAIGLLHERRGDQTEARRRYELATHLCPRLRNGHERLAALAVRDGRWEIALRHYDALAELEPGDLDVLLMAAAIRLNAGAAEAAVEAFQNALLVEPECTDEEIAGADSLAEAGALDQAIDKLARMIEHYPGVPEFHVHLADLYVKAGSDIKALSHYGQALALHPSFLEATIKLGTQHLRQGRHDEAARSFNRAVELNDRLLTAFVGLAVAQKRAGRLHDAAATLELAVNLEPNSTLLLCETARLRLRPGDGERRGESADPPPAGSLSDLGTLGEIIRRHRQALVLCPEDAELHFRCGVLLKQAGRFDQAFEAFQRAVQINPAFAKAQLRLGLCLSELGQDDAAWEALEAALGADRKLLELHYQLGLLFTSEARFNLSVERYERELGSVAAARAFRRHVTLALQNVGTLDRAQATWQAMGELTGRLDLSRRIESGLGSLSGG